MGLGAPELIALGETHVDDRAQGSGVPEGRSAARSVEDCGDGDCFELAA